MSMMTYLEAIESVLSRELEAQTDLILFRPGARRALEEAERDIALPRLGKAEFSIALGAALAGMHPVLDLRQEKDCAGLLLDALCELPAAPLPAMTVIAGAEDADVLAELPGVLTLYPKTPRQAAGFARAALRSSRMTLLIADQSLYAEEDEVPEDDDFMMLPLDTEMPDEAEEEAEDSPEEPAAWQEVYEEMPEEEGGQAEDIEEPAVLPEMTGEAEEDEDLPEMAGEETTEETALPEKDDEETAEESVQAEMPEAEAAETAQPEAASDAEAPDDGMPEAAKEADVETAEESGENCEEARNTMRMRFCATHMMTCDLTKLRALADELETSETLLIEKCMAHACGGRILPEWRHDAEAAAGEAAFLAPESAGISLWLGWDVLTASYDAAAVDYAEAAKLMRAVRRVLEKPVLLIYDKEYDER